MKRPRRGSTIKQVAYATRMMNGAAGTKKEAALLSGFSMSVAENVKHKVEDTEGFKNAMAQLHMRSGNLLNAIMYEFEVRGLTEFTNKDLISALNAMSGAWDRINNRQATAKMRTDEGNPLRAVLTRRVETQTAVIEQIPAGAAANAVVSPEPTVREAEISSDPNDF